MRGGFASRYFEAPAALLTVLRRHAAPARSHGESDMNLDTRVAALAAFLALVALVAGLGLAASDAQAPELPAILTDGFALAFAQNVQAPAPGDDEGLPAVCRAGPVSFDCT